MKLNSGKLFIILSVFTLFISISSIAAADINSVEIDTANSVTNDLNIDTVDIYPVNQDNAWGAGILTQEDNFYPVNEDNAWGAGILTQEDNFYPVNEDNALGAGILTEEDSIYPVNEDNAWGAGPLTQDDAVGAWA